MTTLDQLEKNQIDAIRRATRNLFWGDIIQATLGFMGFLGFVALFLS